MDTQRFLKPDRRTTVQKFSDRLSPPPINRRSSICSRSSTSSKRRSSRRRPHSAPHVRYRTSTGPIFRRSFVIHRLSRKKSTDGAHRAEVSTLVPAPQRTIVCVWVSRLHRQGRGIAGQRLCRERTRIWMKKIRSGSRFRSITLRSPTGNSKPPSAWWNSKRQRHDLARSRHPSLHIPNEFPLTTPGTDHRSAGESKAPTPPLKSASCSTRRRVDYVSVSTGHHAAFGRHWSRSISPPASPTYCSVPPRHAPLIQGPPSTSEPLS